MTADRITSCAETVARKLVADLKDGVIHRIGGETVERACDAALQLAGADRELLIDTATRRVVELV